MRQSLIPQDRSPRVYVIHENDEWVVPLRDNFTARGIPFAEWHLDQGILDLRGSLGRWFGGIGTAAPAPTLLVSACQGDTLDVRGEDADRARMFAERFLASHGIRAGARVCVHHTLPRHAGLGSGTQLALAVARSLAELHRLPIDASSLARAVGRYRQEGPAYPGICAGRTVASVVGLDDHPYVWCFRVQPEALEFVDGFRGPMSIRIREVGGDFVVWKSLGTSVYQLVVVVDDAA